ncbi:MULTISPECIES: CBS domain-containing protein [Chryseobacterium]|uniref:CBS domain-containing protein n=2 Tax=Chryseobacterium TaxID=59732 RepID=A0A1N7P6A5_9FLAO|nr:MULTISPECIES: CBS domain-containing protein [Chryseobacterium]MCF2219680.1 CBS domain-containing protein [Chryseobacterium sp. PS-8]PTT75066.1 CBS domain-containing protein [Chryseobacterium sp. HMWF001]PVV61355.1 CBS domain-containing protein [Chryseobacterium sp. HMWF035]WBX96774.1 CBS domain-containing protein [Chryseobacterium gambrini]SIT06078.1 CBS domain-containing protein [Chryseobacterium gambrini]
MKQRIPVSQIMTKDLITLNVSNTLYDAEKLFKNHKIRHIPVVEDKKLLGVLSYSDLLKISYADVEEAEDVETDGVSAVVYDIFSISQVMTKSPMIVEPNTTIKEVVEILSEQSFHSIPVVENGELKGIVTTTDILKYLLKQY